MQRALLVVPREHPSVNQYRRIRTFLEQNGFQVQVAASRREHIQVTDFVLMPDLALSEARGGDYDVVIFVAGRGNTELWHASEAHQVARDALRAGKVVGAGGAAVGILANAGLLQGRRATGPISMAAMLKAYGADYTPGPVAVDGGIVTLRKSEAFPFFAERVLEQAARWAGGG